MIQAGLLMWRMNKVPEVLLALPTKTDVFPNPMWLIPKGGHHKGESMKETAIREFTEECFFGYENDMEIQYLIKHIKENIFYLDKLWTKKNEIWIYYTEDIRPLDKSYNFKYRSNWIEDPKLSHLTENDDWKWFSEHEVIINENIYPIYKKPISKLFRFIDEKLKVVG